jgi:hypothetical protein
MAEWRIEATKTDSRCRQCGAKIPRGDLRFGTPTKTRWFHLECAAQGAPVVFPQFKSEADALLAKSRPESRALPRAQLEAALASNEDGALVVLADLLTQGGDPWGELITLNLHGEAELADAHLRKHSASLFGALQRKEVVWRDGVISAASFRGKAPQLVSGLERLGATRTAGRLEALQLDGPIDSAVLASVSRFAPRLKNLLLCGTVEGFEALELKKLDTLRLTVPFSASLSSKKSKAPELDGLLKEQLPSLRVLRLTTHQPVSQRFLEGLLESKLLTQLEWLDFDDESNLMRTLDDAGLRLLLANKKKLASIKAMWIERTGRQLDANVLAAANAFFDAKGKRALKLAKAFEEPFE